MAKRVEVRVTFCIWKLKRIPKSERKNYESWEHFFLFPPQLKGKGYSILKSVTPPIFPRPDEEYVKSEEREEWKIGE